MTAVDVQTARPGVPRALLVTGMFGAAFVLALNDAANSNRPHELTAAPWVALLALGALVLGVGALRRRRGVRGLGSHLVTAWLAVVIVVDALLFVGAACSVPAVLAAD